MKVVVIAVFLTLGLCSSGCVNRTEEAVVASVNGKKITAMEMHYWMQQNRTNVYNDFYQRYKAGFDQQFWLADFEGVRPIDVLKLKALNDALGFKVQQILAAEIGIHVYLSHEQMIHEMHQVNAQRTQTYLSGELVYGPINYTLQTYYNYIIDSLALELRYLLALEEQCNIIVGHFYEMDVCSKMGADSLFFNRLRTIEKYYDAFVDRLVETADVEICQKQFAKLMIN